MLRGGLRPWSQTMVSEGARPWGRGRSGDCELPFPPITPEKGALSPKFPFPCDVPQRNGDCLTESILKRCVPKTLAFAFGLRLRSKMRCFKTRVLGRSLPNGKPQERLRFRALRGKTLTFKKRIAIASNWRFKDFPRCQGLRLGRLHSKNAAFCVCVSKPAK